MRGLSQRRSGGHTSKMLHLQRAYILQRVFSPPRTLNATNSVCCHQAPRVNAPTGPLTNLHVRNQSCGTISTAGVETGTNTKGAWNLSLGLAHQKTRDGDMSLKTKLPITSESLKFNMVATKRGFTSTGRRDSAGRAVAQTLEWITDVIIMGRARSPVLVTFAG
jgi:hypothetical protein